MTAPRKLTPEQSATLTGLGRKQKRARHQAGTVEQAGKRRPIWRGFYYVYEPDATGKEVRHRRSIDLGERKALTLRQARIKLAAHIETLEAEKSATGGGDLTLDWFWRERFLPSRQSKWAPASKYTAERFWPCYIAPQFGKCRLVDIDKFSVQQHLDRLAAEGYGKSTISKVRMWICAAMSEAVEQGFVDRNPVTKCHMPQIEKRAKPYASIEDIAKLLDGLKLRDSIIVRLGLVCGLRKSEIFGLRWNDYRGEQLMIDESVWRTTVGDTKNATSTALVTLPVSLQADIQAWHKQVTTEYGEIEPATDEWMFCSAAGTPIYPDNFLRRVLKPAAIRAGIPWFNFRVARRTCATHMDQVAGGIKNVQAHLRHASPEMTLGTYVQAIPEAVRVAVESLDVLLTSAKKKDKV